jgi:para-nitrobenzyl esterase
MKSVIVASAIALLLASAAAAAEPVKVRIDSGVLVGSTDNGVNIFKGVPFAKPVVGDLRWQPPQRPDPWKGDRQATEFGLPCPQPINADGTVNGGGVKGQTSEDCLTLNVWAPKNARNAPVMVWLYGGAGYLGAGHLGSYQGDSFARDGVVVVTINYRLGALGTFAHPALTKAAKPGEALVNYQLMDVIAALQWVQRNAASFGGDKSNVTLFGQSAGGSLVSMALASPAAKGLFQKAIIHSGANLAGGQTVAAAEANGVKIATALGAPGAVATLAQLRAIPADAFPANPATRAGVGSTLDGVVRTTSLRDALTNRTAADVPVIVGSNNGEPGASGANDIVNLAKDGNAGAWQYYFTYVPARKRANQPQGAIHSDEIGYAFDSLKTAARGGPDTTDQDRAVAAEMHSCWVAFAKMPATSKSIACKNGFTWPARSSDNDVVAQFGDQPALAKAQPIIAQQAAAAQAAAAQRQAAQPPTTPVRSE